MSKDTTDEAAADDLLWIEKNGACALLLLMLCVPKDEEDTLDGRTLLWNATDDWRSPADDVFPSRGADRTDDVPVPLSDVDVQAVSRRSKPQAMTRIRKMRMGDGKKGGDSTMG